MTDCPISPEAAVPVAREPRTRILLILVALAFPVLVGLFNLYVCPILPVPVHVGEADSPEALRATQSILTEEPIVMMACLLSSLALGIVKVRNVSAVTFFFGLLTTAAALVTDGQGACLGLIAFPLLYWPVIWIGFAIRRVFIRRV